MAGLSDLCFDPGADFARLVSQRFRRSDYGEDYSESEEDDEHAESEDEGSESEMQDEGDEDWTSNNGKSGESDDEDALKSVEHMKKSVDDLKRKILCASLKRVDI
ncbi:uncharacterized protein [Miscanthus floridulus]|uniref:uncharacterized protein n=1 Tax=Miscanthus floridulus TaxID=154761 RepID=UPI00345B34E8